MAKEEGAEGRVRNNRRQSYVCGGCGAAGAGGAGDAWRALGAELAGTALLLLLGCAPAACSAAVDTPLAAGAAELTFGLVVVVLVQSFDHISGAQLNPTVTLASLVLGRLSARRAAGYVAAQLAGAVLGRALLLLLAPPPAAAAAAVCVTLPADNVSAFQAVAVEAALSGALTLLNCAAWDPRNRRLVDSWPLRVGLSVAGLSLAGSGLTGASMNPARSFGPALVTNTWRHHWVYWAGPLLGSLACSLAYRGGLRAGPGAPARGDDPPAPTAPALPAPPAEPAAAAKSRYSWCV